MGADPCDTSRMSREDFYCHLAVCNSCHARVDDIAAAITKGLDRYRESLGKLIGESLARDGFKLVRKAGR